MVVLKKQKARSSKLHYGALLLILVFGLVAALQILLNYDPTSTIDGVTVAADESSSPVGTQQITSKTKRGTGFEDLQVSQECSNLPVIRPSGVFFVNPQVNRYTSADGINPRFFFGSFLKKGVVHHMVGDTPMLHMIKERIPGTVDRDQLIAFDIGANQGFYTYFLATLGLQVHSFEIDENNYQTLQHGLLYNPKTVSDRVNLYALGLSDTEGRVGQKRNSGRVSYDGFLQKGHGPILTASFDCFAYHVHPNLDKVAFVKIDVEGFEIAVLRGAKKSLLGAHTIGALLIEVGPHRWSRAGISIQEGISEMIELSSHFKKSHVLLRGGDTCPGTLGSNSTTIHKHTPQALSEAVNMFRMDTVDWKPLLEEMDQLDADCNFWFTN